MLVPLHVARAGQQRLIDVHDHLIPIGARVDPPAGRCGEKAIRQ